jgi:hypothetical protein
MALFAFSGCATQGVSSLNHRLNVPQKIENEKILDKTYSKVWDDLIKQLSKSFYVIKNIDKESRIIKISFISNNPENYLDCGETTRTYRQGNNFDKYVYNPAESLSYRLAAEKQTHPYFSEYYSIKRNTSLEGISNIIIGKNHDDKNKTNLSINTIYILNVEVSGQSYAQPANGNPFMTEKLPNKKTTILFKTNSPETHIFDYGEKMTCSSKGTLEREILSMAND